MKINLKIIIIYIFLFLLLFADTISSLTNLYLITYFDEIIIILILIYSVLYSINTKKITTISFKLLFLTLIFSIVGVLSCALNSEFILLRVINSNFLAIKFFVIVVAIANIKIKKETSNIFLNAILFYAKINVLVGIFNFIFPNIYYNIFPFAEKSIRYGFTAISGLFNHPGKYGWFMLASAIISYIIYNKNKNQKKYKIFMIIFAIFALLSFRTKVVISLVMIIIYELFFKNIKKFNFSKLALVTIVISSIFLIFYDLVVNTYNLYFTSKYTLSARQALLNNGIEIMSDYFPLGVGFGKYGSWYARIYYSEYYKEYKMSKIYGLYPNNPMYATDTFWPAIFGETGFLGTIIFVYMLFFILKKLKVKNFENEEIINHVSFLLLLQTICESFGEPSFNSSPQNVVVAIIIGIGLSITTTKEKERNNENESINNNSSI